MNMWNIGILVETPDSQNKVVAPERSAIDPLLLCNEEDLEVTGCVDDQDSSTFGPVSQPVVSRPRPSNMRPLYGLVEGAGRGSLSLSM